jgi:hypothetical protein
VFTGHQTQKGHQAARRREAPKAVELRHQHRGGQGVDAPKALERAYGRRVLRSLAQPFDTLFKASQALLDLVDAQQVVIESELIVGLLETEPYTRYF